MREAVLHTILLDLQKEYNSLEQERCLNILAGYGVGPLILQLLQTYCTRLRVVAKTDGYFALPFQGYRGATQGEPPPPPTVFNVVVDAVIRHWMTVVVLTLVGAEVLRDTIQELAELFYVD